MKATHVLANAMLAVFFATASPAMPAEEQPADAK